MAKKKTKSKSKKKTTEEKSESIMSIVSGINFEIIRSSVIEKRIIRILNDQKAFDELQKKTDIPPEQLRKRLREIIGF